MPEELKNKLMSKPIPKYSKGEEIFNWVSHLVGAVFALGTLIYFIYLSCVSKFDGMQIFSLIFYSISMLFLYLNSTIYHVISPNSPWKRVMRLIDHNTIYFLIVGTYFPICMFAFNVNGYHTLIMGIEVACLIFGCLLNFANMNNKFIKVITVILYVVMGWLIVMVWPAAKLLELNTFLIILFGGISYTVGVICYAIGKKKKWMHSVFHLFVLIGTFLQFAGILMIVL